MLRFIIRPFFSLVAIFFLLSFSPRNAINQKYNAFRIDTGWFTPDDGYNLIVAADSADTVLVSMLIARGANVNAETWEGVTALMYASQRGSYDVVKMLLEHGADIHHRADDGSTALFPAVKFGYGPVADLLLMSGIDQDTADRNGVTPLMYAAAYDQYELADILLFYHADLHAKDYDGNTALMTSVYNGAIDVSDLLLQNGAQANEPDYQGFTPLMVSAQQGDSAMCQLLIQNGADANAVNQNGYDALCIALQHQHSGLVKILVEHGADPNRYLSVSTKTIDLAPRKSEARQYLKSVGAKHGFLPVFTQASAGMKASFNTTDYINGLFFSLMDSRYGLNMQSELLMRMGTKWILTPGQDDFYYQFRERRFVWNNSLSKEFILSRSESSTFGIYTAAGMGFTWGYYVGAARRPVSRYYFYPEAGLVYRTKHLNLQVGYGAMPWKVEKIQPGRLQMMVSFVFPLRSEQMWNKNIPWIDE